MRSARVLLALTGAGGRPVLRQPLVWRALSSVPKNPFEIDLNALKTTTTEKLTLEDAKQAAATQQADAQRDIDLLHDEMSSLFGEEVAEHGDNATSTEEAAAAFELKRELAEESRPVRVKEKRAVRAEIKQKEVKEQGSSGQSSSEAVDVLLLQGPCSFVKDVWTGGDVKRTELQRQLQSQADKLKIGVKSRNYDSESIILKMLLDAREDQVIILSWNISLSKSPFVLHALELTHSRVLIVSPSNVEHGPLPANVVGVLSGFWNQSLSLALNAAANLVGTNVDKKNYGGNVKEEPQRMKKKVVTCFLCGEVGHMRSKCPQLPRNKA